MLVSLPASIPRLLLRTTALAALVCVAGGTQAQSNPYILRASQSFTYDSNIFRAPPGGRIRRDVISTTTLGAGIDQPYGRQRYLADAAVNANFYRNNNDYNNTGYNLLLGMDWEALRDWAGDIRLTSSRRLAQFEDFSQEDLAQSRQRDNRQRNDTLAFRARYGLFATWSLDGTAGYRRLSFSEPAFAPRNYDVAYISGGASYRPSDLVRLGALIRYSDGEYPDTPVTDGGVVRTVNNPFNRIDYELNANLRLTGLSTIDGRIAFSKEEYDVTPGRDFDGATGSIAWIYQPTAKSRFDVRLARDTATRGDSDSDGRASSDTQLSTLVSASWRWAATAKISTTANLSYSRDRYDILAFRGTDLAVRTTDAGKGSTRSFGLAATYAYSRALSFDCGIRRLSRSADLNPTATTTNYNYKATVADCAVEFAIQ